MELRRELILSIGALVVLNLLLAFGVIGLFARMGPAIERIMKDNVYSIAAGEEVLAVFAEAGGAPLSIPARERLRQALLNAHNNVTEPEEEAYLIGIEGHVTSAMEGDAHARMQVVQGVRELIQINRKAMWRVDDEARHLGTSGAWTAVLLGFVSFAFSLFIVVRLQKRLVRPLVELHEVLESVQQGNHMRRCRLADAPREVVQVAQAVNRLLDERINIKSAGAGKLP